MDDPDEYRRLPWKVFGFFHSVHTYLGRFYSHVFRTDDDSFVNVGYIEKSFVSQRTPENQNDYGRYQNAWRCSLLLDNCGRFTHQRMIQLSPSVFFLSRWHLFCSYNDKVGFCQRQVPPSSNMLQKEYPVYSSGAGYLMSRRFMQCAVSALPHRDFWYDEDANTGGLARFCKVPCTHDRRISPWIPKTGSRYGLLGGDVFVQHYIKSNLVMAWHHKLACEGPNADKTSCRPEPLDPIEMVDIESRPISCGGHMEKSCSQCPGEHGMFWCNGMCHWCKEGAIRDGNHSASDPISEFLRSHDLKHGRDKGDQRCVLLDYQCLE